MPAPKDPIKYQEWILKLKGSTGICKDPSQEIERRKKISDARGKG